jgi:hypothetical protein
MKSFLEDIQVVVEAIAKGGKIKWTTIMFADGAIWH